MLPGEKDLPYHPSDQPEQKLIGMMLAAGWISSGVVTDQKLPGPPEAGWHRSYTVKVEWTAKGLERKQVLLAIFSELEQKIPRKIAHDELQMLRSLISYP